MHVCGNKLFSLLLLGIIGFSSQTTWGAAKFKKKLVSQGTQTDGVDTGTEMSSIFPNCQGYYSAGFRSWKDSRYSRSVISSQKGVGKGMYHYFQASFQDGEVSLFLRDEMSGDTVETQKAMLDSDLHVFRARVDHFPKDVELDENWERPLLLVFCAYDLKRIQKLKNCD